MFEQTVYQVLRAQYSEDKTKVEWVENDAKSISLKDGKIVSAVINQHNADETILIDDVTAFARRGTTMFDKVGKMIFAGDIVKFTIQHKSDEPKEVLAPIVFINGAYCIALEELAGEIIYLTQQNVLEMEKVGTVYQHGKLLETPVDEAIFAVGDAETNV